MHREGRGLGKRGPAACSVNTLIHRRRTYSKALSAMAGGINSEYKKLNAYAIGY